MYTLFVIGIVLAIIGFYKYWVKGENLLEMKFYYAFPLIVYVILIFVYAICGFVILSVKYLP